MTYIRRNTLWVGDWQALGEKEIPYLHSVGEAESSFARTSLTWVSPSTGDVWAKSEVFRDGVRMPFFVMTKPGPLEPHRGSYGVSGSFMAAGHWMLNQLPRNQLRLELLFHCDNASHRTTTIKEILQCLKNSPAQTSSSWDPAAPEKLTV